MRGRRGRRSAPRRGRGRATCRGQARRCGQTFHCTSIIAQFGHFAAHAASAPDLSPALSRPRSRFGERNRDLWPDVASPHTSRWARSSDGRGRCRLGACPGWVHDEQVGPGRQAEGALCALRTSARPGRPRPGWPESVIMRRADDGRARCVRSRQARMPMRFSQSPRRSACWKSARRSEPAAAPARRECRGLVPQRRKACRARRIRRARVCSTT